MSSHQRFSLFIEATSKTQGAYQSLEEAMAAVDRHVDPGGRWSITEFSAANTTSMGHTVAEGRRGELEHDQVDRLILAMLIVAGEHAPDRDELYELIAASGRLEPPFALGNENIESRLHELEDQGLVAQAVVAADGRRADDPPAQVGDHGRRARDQPA